MEEEPRKQHLPVAEEDAHQGEEVADEIDHIEHYWDGQVQGGILKINVC